MCNDYFAIERSLDGRSFSTIGQVDAAGNSSSPQTYTYYDKAPANGMNYYRITQVDADGQRSSTGVKTLRSDCGNGTVKVYPIPSKGTVHVELPTGYEQAKLTVTAIDGRQVPAAISKDGLSRTVQLSSLAAGTYLLSVEGDKGVETFKILYQP